MKLNKLKTRKRWNETLLYALVIFTSFCFSANAQQTTVTGIVTSSEDGGFPIPGVAVILQGTNTGAVSDFDGNYSINANIGDVLKFTYLGMNDKFVKVTGNKLNVQLDPSLEDLEEVVVIGYGTQKKKEVTGAVAQVKSEDIEQFVTADIGSALQGQVAGVNITASSGEPGEASSIQIRGITSLTGSNTPLFVVDGIPQEGDPRLAPNEIETIDILKDAASAAVYGVRGAAGVILITTKRGEEGAMSVKFNTTYGVQNLQQDVPLMNTEEQIFFEIQRNKFFLERNPGGPPGRLIPANVGPRRAEWLNNDTNIRELVLVSNPDSKTYNLNISGGTKSISYNVSGGYFNQGGILVGSNFKRYNGRANTTYKSEKWKIDASIGFVIEDRDRATNQLLTAALRYRPYFPEIDRNQDVFIIDSEDGNGAVSTPLNGIATAFRRRDNERTDKINVSLSIARELTDDLKFTTRLGTNVTNGYRNVLRPRFALFDLATGTSEVDPAQNGVSASALRRNVFSLDGILTYKKSFGDHNFNLVGSASLDERTNEAFIAARGGLTTDDFDLLNAGALNLQSANSLPNYVRKNVGFLGRVQYNYKGKYLLSALVRRDGSSRFLNAGPSVFQADEDFRWGTFPSVSAAWNVSDESFWKPLKSTINNFKIRLSHGTVGNDNLPDYAANFTVAAGRDYVFDSEGSQLTPGFAIDTYANPNLKWETSVSNNIGVDINMFKNKIRFTADYYDTRKRDMLFPIRFPGSTGVVTGENRDVPLNVGNMTNKGLELALNYRNSIGKSKINMGLTFTRNRNEITKIEDGTDIIFNSNSNVLQTPVTVLKVGREAGAFFLHETQGTIKNQVQLDEYKNIDSNARLGDLIYTDQDGDGEITDADRVYSGSGLPDFEIGFNMNWTYRNFDLSMNWYASVGAEIINGVKADAYSRFRHRDLTNMWTPENPNSDIPFFVDRAVRHPNFNGDTDLWVENGDYLRLKLVSLGYTLPQDITKKIGLTKFRVFASAQNPITITKYDGYDPEIGGIVTRRGIDNSRFPLAALYSFGLNLNF